MVVRFVWEACCYLQKGTRIPPGGVKDADPSSIGVRRDEKDDKEGRLRMIEARRINWLNRRMVRELVMELVDNTSTEAVVGHIKNIMV